MRASESGLLSSSSAMLSESVPPPASVESASSLGCSLLGIPSGVSSSRIGSVRSDLNTSGFAESTSPPCRDELVSDTLASGRPLSKTVLHHCGMTSISTIEATAAAAATFQFLRRPRRLGDRAAVADTDRLVRSLGSSSRTSSSSPQFWTRSASGSRRQRSTTSSNRGANRPAPNPHADGSGSRFPPSAA